MLNDKFLSSACLFPVPLSFRDFKLIQHSSLKLSLDIKQKITMATRQCVTRFIENQSQSDQLILNS